jgi:hypothetical protein
VLPDFLAELSQWSTSGLIKYFGISRGWGKVFTILYLSVCATRRDNGWLDCDNFPLPDVGVASIREICPASSEDITPRSSVYGLMSQSHVVLPTSDFGLVCGVFAGRHQPLPLPGFSRRYFCESFLRCPSRYPGGLLSVFAWFFPSIHRLSPSFDWGSFPLPSANTTFRWSALEAASSFVAFSAPSLLASDESCCAWASCTVRFIQRLDILSRDGGDHR